MLNMVVWGASLAFTSGPVQAMVVGSVGMGERSKVFTASQFVGGFFGFLGQVLLLWLFAQTGNSWDISSMSFIMFVGYIICIARALLLFSMRDDAMLPDAGGSLADEPKDKNDPLQACCPSCSRYLPIFFLAANIVFMLGSGMTDAVRYTRRTLDLLLATLSTRV